jgi:hypothetical protein
MALRRILFGGHTNKEVSDTIAMTILGNATGALWIGVPAIAANNALKDGDCDSMRRSLTVGAVAGGAFGLVIEREPRALALRIIAAQGLAAAVSVGR